MHYCNTTLVVLDTYLFSFPTQRVIKEGFFYPPFFLSNLTAVIIVTEEGSTT